MNITVRIATLVAVCAAMMSCAGQSTSATDSPAQANPVGHVVELNRSGEWKEAAQVGQGILDSDVELSLAEQCETYFNLTYAHVRLGQADSALEAVGQFDKICDQTQLPSTHNWLLAEMDKLRLELGLKDGASPKSHDDGFWEVADPTSLEVDIDVLEKHQKLCEDTGADACLVVRSGRIVQEWCSERYRVPMYAMSTTKSITGLLVGMLIDDGKIESIEEPVCTYLPEWCHGDKGKVTLRHLLSMTSGLTNIKEGGVGSVGDKNPFVTSLPLTFEPGTRWSYSNEGVQLLSPILDQAAGEPIQDYARKRLFEPLGMMDTRLHTDTAGHAWTYADMETTPHDLARIGLLMLNEGMWQDQRIISADWVQKSTTKSQSLYPEYGYLWWLHDRPQGFAGHGHLDTNLYIFPELDLIAVRMQSNPMPGVPEGTYSAQALPLFEELVKD
jgi:hypothetical protein